MNTTDSRVELRFDLGTSRAFTDEQRARALSQLAPRLVDGVLRITASEQRSQLQNRLAARARLAQLLSRALQPPAPARRARRPSRAAAQRRLDLKHQRGQVKAGRGRIRHND